MNWAVFLDRDGVINENRPNYVRTPADIEYLPNVFSALQKLAQTGAVIILVTNQSAVGRGIISEAAAHAINDEIISMVQANGGRIDAAYLCPHHPDAGCTCRKPRDGMLQRAAAEHQIDLTRSFMVGDALTDMQAACTASASGVLVLTGRGQAQLPSVRAWNAETPIAADLTAALEWIDTQQH